MQNNPTRITAAGKPWWLFDDGTLLPVVSGAAEAPVDEVDDDLDDDDPDDGRVTDALRKKNSENRNLRRRLKAAEAAAEELAELKKKDQTDSERLTAELAEARTRAEKAEAKASRYEVALNKGLTLRQANRLVGDTVEELEDDADEMLVDLGQGPRGSDAGDDTSSDGDGKPPAGGRPPGRPTENLRGGGKPDDGPEPDIRAIVDSIKPVI